MNDPKMRPAQRPKCMGENRILPLLGQSFPFLPPWLAHLPLPSRDIPAEQECLSPGCPVGYCLSSVETDSHFLSQLEKSGASDKALGVRSKKCCLSAYLPNTQSQ